MIYIVDQKIIETDNRNNYRKTILIKYTLIIIITFLVIRLIQDLYI